MLAFSLFVAMLPLTPGLLTLLGFLTRSPRRFFAAKEVLVDIFPAVTQGAMRQVILGAGEHAGTVALLSIAGLLWFSTGVFSITGFALMGSTAYRTGAWSNSGCEGSGRRSL